MASVQQGMHTAEVEGDFVVFMIGARMDWAHPVRTLRDLGGMRGMPYMLRHLTDHPEKGLLGYESYGPFMNVQYWRSFEDLERFSTSPDEPHRPVWLRYWQRVRQDPRSGIWHETFLVRAGEYEAVYGNMPLHGLAKATRSVPLKGNPSARQRLGRTPREGSAADR